SRVDFLKVAMDHDHHSTYACNVGRIIGIRETFDGPVVVDPVFDFRNVMLGAREVLPGAANLRDALVVFSGHYFDVVDTRKIARKGIINLPRLGWDFDADLLNAGGKGIGRNSEDGGVIVVGGK